MIYALDAAIAIATILAWYFGLLDFASITQQTMWWCIGISVVGAGYYLAGHWTSRHTKLGIETVFVLGLMGTMVGVVTMAASGGDLHDKLPGALVAFISTLAGAVWGLLLRHQSWMSGDRS